MLNLLNFLKQCLAAFCIGTLLFVLTTVAEADTPANAVGQDGLVRVQSAYPVDETVSRLRQDIAAKGITFFQEVDQSKLAAAAGIALRPSTLIVFGNPPLGAQFLTSNPYSGLDWPVRVLVLQEDDGSVWVAWTDFAWIARRHGIADRQQQFAMATSVVESITSTVRSK
jgi:uncharacterized protein (DUF302 family)